MNYQLPRLTHTTLSATALLAFLAASSVNAQSYKALGWETNTSQISDNTTDGSTFAFYAGSSDPVTTTSTPSGSLAYALNGDNVNFQTEALRAAAYSTSGTYVVNGSSITAPGDATIASSTPATPFVAVSTAITGGAWTSVTATRETFNGSGSSINVLQADGVTQAHRGIFQFDAELNNTFTLSLAGLGAIASNPGVILRGVSVTVTDFQNNQTLAEVDNLVFDGTGAVAGISITFNNTLIADTDAADNVVNYDFTKGLSSILAIEVGYGTVVGSIDGGELITGNVFGSYNEFGIQAGFVAPSAVPEPSTYAAIFGGVALGGAALQRRRRA